MPRLLIFRLKETGGGSNLTERKGRQMGISFVKKLWLLGLAGILSFLPVAGCIIVPAGHGEHHEEHEEHEQEWR